jgi:hypothetical protein
MGGGVDSAASVAARGLKVRRMISTAASIKGLHEEGACVFYRRVARILCVLPATTSFFPKTTLYVARLCARFRVYLIMEFPLLGSSAFA